MVRDYNKRLNNYELAQVMFDNDRPVRSVYGKTFATMTDYLYSGDHLLYRSSLEDSYRRSLYTEHHTNKVIVTSNSIHYKCIMAVAGVHLRRNGVPDYMDILNYDMVHSSGPVPDGVLDEYQQMDAAVAMAAYMADHSEFTAVPVQLFGRRNVHPIHFTRENIPVNFVFQFFNLIARVCNLPIDGNSCRRRLVQKVTRKYGVIRLVRLRRVKRAG
jgi:hypothetical protein